MSLTTGQKRLYSGDYNNMGQEEQPDGSIIVTISGGPKNETHRMHVVDLWDEQEEVLIEIKDKPKPPAWMKKRLKEAKEEG